MALSAVWEMAVRVAGIDYSSHYVDLVTVPLDGPGAPVWHRFDLEGTDAFERTRSVAQAVPGPTSVLWDDVLAVGIEHPAGKFGVGPLMRLQGAILCRIPARMLVEPLPPAKWRKQVGLPGNASKLDVQFFAVNDGDDWEFRDWPQDACDAYCIALATRSLVEQPEAA